MEVFMNWFRQPIFTETPLVNPPICPFGLGNSVWGVGALATAELHISTLGIRNVATVSSCFQIYHSECSNICPRSSSSTQPQHDDNSYAPTSTHVKPYCLPLGDLITLHSFPLLQILRCIYPNNTSSAVMFSSPHQHCLFLHKPVEFLLIFSFYSYL